MSGTAKTNPDDFVRQAICRLSPAEKRDLYQSIRDKQDHATCKAGNGKVLVAFARINSGPDGSHIDSKVIKSFLYDKLPKHAIPQKIYLLESMPILASGKIDRSKLKKLASKYLADEKNSGAAVMAATISEQRHHADLPVAELKIQQALINAWEHVLGRPVKNQQDNFFELGGDSILSIHVVSKILQAGYKIGPNDVFDYPTISQLSRKIAANSSDDTAQVRPLPVNHAPVTPIQSWFFYTVKEHLEQWNLARFFRLPEAVSVPMLKDAINRLAADHDAFRVSFIRDSGIYRHALQENAEIAFAIVDLPGETHEGAEIKRQAAQRQALFSLAQAPLFDFVLFKTGSGNILLVTAHHLVMDIISWQVLKKDLQYHLQPGNRDHPPLQSMPFTAWADYQYKLAHDPEITSQIEFWNGQINDQSTQFPIGSRGLTETAAVSKEANRDVIKTRLERGLSLSLDHDAHQNYQTTLPDLLLSAFSLAVLERYGQAQITIDVESHGRFDPGKSIDLSRTIGWFSSVYPLLVSSDPHSSTRDGLIAATIKTTKEKLKQVRHGGIAFGLLKQTNQLSSYASAPPTRILFNYLGNAEKHAQSPSDAPELIELDLDVPGQRHPDNRCTHFIEIQAYFKDSQLQIEWHYDQCLIDGQEIEEFTHCYLRHLQDIIIHCQGDQHGSYTPSDFPDADLDQHELDDFLDSLS